MSEDSPRIVSLPTSFELTDFPSESDDLVESTAPLTLPEESAPVEAADAPAERTQRVVSVGPATVTEFRVRVPEPTAAVAIPALAPGPATLVELIERRGGFDWREAVAVIHQICLYLRDQEPHTPILLEPRNIQITDKGEVRLLSGQTSSDPLVIQVGRLMRTMLMGKDAPPELRLLLAQATFELPIFESIEDVDRALGQLERLEEPKPTGLALLRAVVLPLPNPDASTPDSVPPPPRPILPARRGPRLRSTSRSMRLGDLFSRYGSQIAVMLVAIAVIGGVLTRPSLLFPGASPSSPPVQRTLGQSQPALPLVPDGATPAPAEVTPTLTTVPPARSDHKVAPPGRGSTGIVEATPLESRSTSGDLPRTASNPSRSAATAAASPSPRDSERRATALMAQGQALEASMAFDALVLANPLYEPNAADLTPESLAAFRASQKLLLPVIALRDYDRAKAALAGGDVDRALVLGKEIAAILQRPVTDVPPQLREQVQDLLEKATAANAAADEIVYTRADTGVVPPRVLSRQFPATSPIGIPPHRVGTLEIVIGKEGGVEFVKLHTPLNRYHERMIVQSAKAWRYRPATRGGKPVRYRVTVRINLPESGTDFE